MLSTRSYAAGLLFFLLAQTTPALLPRASAEPSALGAEANAKADEYFRKGKALVKVGRLDEAREAYLDGWEIKKGYDIAGNLGNVELELGMARDAAEHLAYCMRNFPATGTAKQLEFIKSRLAEAKQRVGALSIQVNADGAEIFVDGRSIGRSPFSEDIFVDPGEKSIEAKLVGYAPARKRIEVAAGSWQGVVLLLEPERAPKAPNPTHVGALPRHHREREAEERNRLPVYLGLGATALGIGFGVAGLVLSNQSTASAEERHAALRVYGTSACLGNAHRSACDALDQDYIDKATFRTLSVVGFSAAGALAIGTLTYMLLPSSRDRKTGPRAAFTISPTEAHIVLSGRY